MDRSGYPARFARDHGAVKVVPWCAEWEKVFEEKHAIMDLLSVVAVRVEHIGSTSVVGLPAKPIVDTLVSVTSLAEFDACRRRLEEEATYGAAHRSKGGGCSTTCITLPLDQLQSGLTCTLLSWRMTMQDHPMIQFREIMRKDEQLRKEYGKLKLELSKKAGKNRAAYSSGKSKFIKRALLHRSSGQGILFSLLGARCLHIGRYHVEQHVQR